MARLAFAVLFPFAFVLALVAAAPGDASAKWRGMTAADSRIVFAGRDFDGYRASWHYLPFVESAYRWEGYLATWMAPPRRLPVFWARLQILAPGYHFQDGTQNSLDERARKLSWFRNKPFSAGEDGTAGTVLGQTRYLIFTSGENRCAAFRLFIDDGSYASPNSAGNTLLLGLYCPVDGGLDGASVRSVLAKIGIRDVAVPAGETHEAARPDKSPGTAEEDLAALVTGGDIRGLRRKAVKGLDPDAFIRFDHPRFAGGRPIRRPMLTAAALFGHTEIVVFLLDRGASTQGPAAGAICAAIAMDRAEIVDVLLGTDPALRGYDRCGRNRDLTTLGLAKRLGRRRIADRLVRTDR